MVSLNGEILKVVVDQVDVVDLKASIDIDHTDTIDENLQLRLKNFKLPLHKLQPAKPWITFLDSSWSAFSHKVSSEAPLADADRDTLRLGTAGFGAISFPGKLLLCCIFSRLSNRDMIFEKFLIGKSEKNWFWWTTSR